MDEKRPKRRKDKDNPYTLSKRQDKHYLSFRDGQGVLRELLINKELFELLNCFELDDLSFLNEVDRHYEHSELTEATLYDRAFVLPESVEDAVLRNMRYEALHNAINKLPETQRRRLILYYFKCRERCERLPDHGFCLCRLSHRQIGGDACRASQQEGLYGQQLPDRRNRNEQTGRGSGDHGR